MFAKYHPLPPNINASRYYLNKVFTIDEAHEGLQAKVKLVPLL